MPLQIITLVVDAIMFQLVDKFTSDTTLRLFIPNLIAAIILAYPIWDTYLAMDQGEYDEKALWTPAIAAVIVCGGLLALNLMLS